MTYLFNKNNFIEFLDDFEPEKRVRMVGIYIQGFQAHKETCINATDQRDAEALQATVHDMKSLAYMIKAQDFGQHAEDTEADLMDNKPEDAFKKAKDLLPMVDHVLSVMEAHLAELQG